MSNKSLQRKTLERINDEVIGHAKNSGYFDKVREDLMPLIEGHKDYEVVERRYKNKCELYLTNRSDLHADRRILRTNLEKFADNLEVVDTVGDLVRKILKDSDNKIREKFVNSAEPYLRNRFLPPDSPTPAPLPTSSKPTIAENEADKPNNKNEQETGDDNRQDYDMDIDSCGPESPPAPEFSPISNHGDDLDTKFSDNNTGNLSTDMTTKQEHEEEAPSLEDIPMPEDECPEIPPEHFKDEMPIEDQIPTPVEDEVRNPDECPTPVRDEELVAPIKSEPPSQNPTDENDELEKLTFSSVSSVNTADLSDFEESIKLSDDEANIVGQPRNSKIRIEVLQSTISDLQTKTVDRKLGPDDQQPVVAGQENRDQSETGESDGCGDGIVTGRRATRTRKSNPRYSNDNFTH